MRYLNDKNFAGFELKYHSVVPPTRIVRHPFKENCKGLPKNSGEVVNLSSMAFCIVRLIVAEILLRSSGIL